MRLQIVIPVLLWPLLASGQQGALTSPESLQKALALADVYNWYEAGPLFQLAEREAIAKGDSRSAAFAKIGILRATMEQRVLDEVGEIVAEELAKNPLLQSDPELRIFALQVKGDVDFELDASLAKQDWQEVLQVAQRSDNKKWIRRARGELGLAAFVEGDLLTARQQVSTAVIEATLSGDIGSQVRYLGAIGTGFTAMRNFDEGLTRLDQALAIAAKNPVVGYSFPTQEAKIQALSGLGRLTEAMALAREVAEEAQRRDKRVKEAQVYVTMGKILLKQERFMEAEDRFRAAVRLCEEGGFTRLQAGTYSELSDLVRRNGDIKTAEDLASKAAELTQSSGDLYLLPDRLLALARVQIARSDYPGASAVLSRASGAVETILASSSNPGARSSLINAMSAIFNEEFLLHAQQLKDLPGAWEVLESSRARTTRDLLLQGKPVSHSAADIGRLRLSLLRAKTTRELQSIKNDLFLAEAAQLAVADNPLVLPRQAISIPSLQKELGDDDVLLEYVLADPKSFCFVITRTATRLVELPSSKELDPLLTSYFEALQKKQVAGTAAQAIYRSLLGPMRSELTGKKRLLVARHGSMHKVPLESLIGPNGQYLVMSHAVTYIPSATTYTMLKQRTTQRSLLSKFLGVGDIAYDTSPLPKIAATRGYESKLANLPHSADEIAAAARTLKMAVPNSEPTVLLGNAATEAAFKASIGQYGIIHLAVHATANQSRPTEAALVLLSDEKAGEDGFLEAREVLGLRLNANIVLLSACDTAVGKLLGEDGIATLSRAFLSVGAQTVVSTLWEADDVFASTLVRKFYTYLARGQTVSVALANAKREMIQTFGKQAVPWLWAPYIAEGADDFRLNPPRGGRSTK